MGLVLRNCSQPRTVGKFADRVNDGVAVDTRLSRAKILSGPLEDIRNVEFCGGAEPDVPFPLAHKGPLLGCS